MESLHVIVSSQIFESYLACPTKCWLRSRPEPATGNLYAEWVRAEKETYFKKGLKYLRATFPEGSHVIAPALPKNFRDLTWRLATDVRWRATDLECCLQAIERVPSERRGTPALFIPYRFEFANKLTKEHKLQLAFDAFLLSEVLGRKVTLGKIVHGDGHAILKVKVSTFASEVRKLIKSVTALLERNSPPELLLNRHCTQCEFQIRCHEQAREKDELSLLSSMSDKDRKKLHSKGIFTVTQLSHTFRPRRRRREFRGKQEKYHHSLRALAIRENKIHAVGILDPKFEGTSVFLDVEGLPDRDFYYLIGLRIRTAQKSVQHSFWAENADEEKMIWNNFLDVLLQIKDPQIIHYGSYEKTFLNRMRERHGCPPPDSQAAKAINHTVNLLSLIHAQIYFPTYSNGLKEIAGYLGFRWSGSIASGLETIVWRSQWEAFRGPEVKQMLMDYNRQDCEALELLANGLVDLHRAAPPNGKPSQGKVILTSDMKWEGPYGFKRNEFVLPEMEAINKAAYWDYQRERVYIKSYANLARKVKRRVTRRNKMIPNTTNTATEHSRPLVCPKCYSNLIYGHGRKNRTVIDLRFMRHGIKRWIVRHIIRRYRCSSCGNTSFPMNSFEYQKKYGHNLVAYILFQNIELGVSQNRIARSMEILFDLNSSASQINEFKVAAAKIYEYTYNQILKKLCCGRLLHVDETRAGSCKNGYVWVLANMEEVAYFYTPNRAGDTVQILLRDFSGVLVSDFYAAYEAINCPQQKCLIHLIRDLNDELLRHPYDEELKRLCGVFTDLLKPMIETVDRRGLKRRFLRKHRILVDRFYKRLNAGEFDTSEAAKKIVERLQKNRNSMFTFLDFDGVPWNNNNAEHAIKAFAGHRGLFAGQATEKSLRDFLILLSVRETCKCRNIDFLDFLRSGSKDFDDFLRKSQGALSES